MYETSLMIQVWSARSQVSRIHFGQILCFCVWNLNYSQAMGCHTQHHSSKNCIFRVCSCLLMIIFTYFDLGLFINDVMQQGGGEFFFLWHNHRVLCILTSEQVICMPFTGQNHCVLKYFSFWMKKSDPKYDRCLICQNDSSCQFLPLK